MNKRYVDKLVRETVENAINEGLIDKLKGAFDGFNQGQEKMKETSRNAELSKYGNISRLLAHMGSDISTVDMCWDTAKDYIKSITNPQNGEISDYYATSVKQKLNTMINSLNNIRKVMELIGEPDDKIPYYTTLARQNARKMGRID